MARQRTLSELLEDIRVLADVPAFTSTTKPTKVQATRLINRSLYRARKKWRAAGTVYKTSTIAVSSGTTSYSLPSDFAALEDGYLRFTDGDGSPRVVHIGTMADIGMDGSDPVGWENGPARGVIRGRQLLTNDPKDSFTVTIGYVPETVAFDSGDNAQSDLSADTDYINSEAGVDDWVALDVAITIVGTIEERDPTALLQEMSRTETDLIEAMRERDDDPILRIQDTWRAEDGDYAL